MKSRRYFTCPIQALYMMKEFGVKLECENESSSYYYSFGKAMLDHIRREVLKDITWEKHLGKIYVDKESEHIFEQKEGDIGIQQDNGYLAIAKAQEFEDFEENNGAISPSHYWKIIMRDNKHFFMGELENER